MSKLNLNPMAEYDYGNNSRGQFTAETRGLSSTYQSLEMLTTNQMSGNITFSKFVQNVAKDNPATGKAYMGKVSFTEGLPESYTEGTMTVTVLSDDLVKYIFNSPVDPYSQYECYSLNGGEPTQWSKGEGGGGVADLMAETTWSNLVTLRDNSQLIPGMKYRITDYNTTTSQQDTQSASHQFDIIVTADDINILNENANAIQHEGDTYFSDCNLNAWELKYSLDNDKSRFGWACDGVGGFYIQYEEKKTVTLMRTSIIEGEDVVWVYDTGEKEVYYTHENPQVGDDIYSDEELQSVEFTISATGEMPGTFGTGVIWWMKDEYDNELYYDFKNIQFKRYEITTVYEGNGETSYTDGSGNPSELIGKWGLPISGRIDVDTETSEWFFTFSSVNNGDVVDATLSFDYNYINGDGSGAGKNVIGYTSKGKFVIGDNVFVNDNGNLICYSNIFGNNVENNTFGNGVQNNTFGNSVQNNTFGNGVGSNTFGNYLYQNTFGNSVGSNTFGNDIYQNTFGNSVGYNTFGNDIYRNTFGNSVQNNTFGNYLYQNTFGNSVRYNTFGNNIYQNTFGNNIYQNTFGNGVQNNTFGNKQDSSTALYSIFVYANVSNISLSDVANYYHYYNDGTNNYKGSPTTTFVQI